MNSYKNVHAASRADRLPDRFDLRDRGVVPPVRNQWSFGTCWGFATMGAAEISLLSDLGLTYEEYLELTGKEMDLSEKHLAWFASVPIAETEDMTEHDLAQVGEGRVLLDDDGSAASHLSIGGLMTYGSEMFSSGIGPLTEEEVPYTANDGSTSTAKDWSLAESMRFQYEWELKDSSILPSPAGRDENGNYVYSAVATEMIKQELIAGRGVSIAYHADQAMDPEADYAMLRDQLIYQGIPERFAEMYILDMKDELDINSLSEADHREYKRATFAYEKSIPYSEITDEMLDEMIEQDRIRLEQILKELEEEAENGIYMDDRMFEDEPTEEELAEQVEAEATMRAAAERLGIDADALIEWRARLKEAKSADCLNTETYAQYTWNQDSEVTHAVVIIGYDDNYPAENFLAEHRPPADGAWIVRNSWGSSYGNDGYFYLSYYDRSICCAETFEFVTDDDSINVMSMEIEEYDFMPAEKVCSADATEPVYMANEFTTGHDSALTYVSTMTANLDTDVTVAVYLLNEDSADPTDGELLDIRTMDFRYAGYHRIPLNMHYRLPAGTKVGVVQTQRYRDTDGIHYALPYTMGLNRAYSETLNLTSIDGEDVTTYGVEGKIGRGESFIRVDNEWIDWVDFIAGVGEIYPQAKEFVSFDNLSMKIYLYHPEDIFDLHDFGDAVPYAGGSLQMCTECGYPLVEQ